MAEPARQINDDESIEPEIRPRFGVISGGGESTERKEGHLRAVKNEESAENLEESEVRAGGSSSESPASDTPSPKQLKEAESSPDDTVGAGYREERKSVKARLATRRNAVGGGIAGIAIFGSIFFFSIASGPLQFIHFGQILQKFHFSNNENFANGRTYRYLKNRLKSGKGYAKMNTRLGRIGGKIADAAELRLQSEGGLRTVYDSSTGNLKGWEIIDKNKAVNLLTEANIDPNVDLPTDPPGTTTHVVDSLGNTEIKGPVIRADQLDGKSFKTRFAVQKAILKANGTSKIGGALSARLGAKRGGWDWHPLRRLDARANEAFVNFARSVLEKWGKEAKTGATAPDSVDLTQKDANGDPIPVTEESNAAAKETEGLARSGSGEAIASTAKKLAGVGAASVGVLCTVRALSKGVEDLKYLNIVMPLMRVGFRVISAGNQVMTGQDVSMDELRAVSQNLYDAKTGLGWSSARSIQAELGEPQTGPDISPSAKPSAAGEKPELFDIVDSIFNEAGVLGSAACSTIGQWTLNVVTGQVVSSVVTEVLTRTASAAGVNPFDALASWIVSWLAGNPVDVNAAGADLGNLANYGARLAANDQAISMGGTALSDAQVAQLDANSRAQDISDFQQNSLYARVLDIHNSDSVAAKALFENNNMASIQATSSSIVRSLFNILPNIGSMFSKILMPNAYAAADYKYGFPEFGFSQALQDDSRFQDPYANAQIVEDQYGLQKLNDDYGDCFSMKINPSTGAIEPGKATKYEKNSKCNSTTDIRLLRYRFYLADTVISKSVACYEGVDDGSCSEIGFGGGSTTPSSVATTASSQIVGNPYESSVNVACASGTKDLGIHDAYADGNLIKMRLCALPNLRSSGEESGTGQWGISGAGGFAIVNSRVSGAWYALVNDAKTAGIVLGANSTFRTMEHQQQLWDSAGHDSSRVARPGYSSHQAGVAIDFSGMDPYHASSGATCATRQTRTNNSAWQWLYKNAEKYGFKQYAAEAWHWDALPIANRCGAGS